MEILTRMETTSTCGFSTRKAVCGAPRAAHRRGKNHPYQPVFRATPERAFVVASCKCGVEATRIRPEFDTMTDFGAVKEALNYAGWRIIGHLWTCPACTVRFDKREAKKIHPAQASFMEST